MLGLSACGDDLGPQLTDGASAESDADVDANGPDAGPGTSERDAGGDGAASSADAGAPTFDAQADRDASTDAALADAAAAEGGARDASADGAADAAACTPGSGAPELDVISVSATAADGGSARKGEPLALSLVIENRSSFGAMLRVTPRLDSLRFSDYTGVPLGQVSALVCPGENTLRVVGGPFLSHDQKSKHYALGSGEYQVASVTLEPAGAAARSDTQLEGARFRVQTSNALLVPVVYDARYFQQIQGLGNTTPEAFLTRAFTRKNELFTPSGSDSDGAGDYQSFAGGFDQMLNVRHLFRLFPGFPGEDTTAQGWCEDATAYGATALGMAAAWDSRPAQTRPERHGFDYLMALTPDMGGGVACGWLDVQVSSFINRDVDRQQVIAVHETGHLFGAPHCDDVGNGSGGSLQGYVMCSGEKHMRYPDAFVWHATSRPQLRSHWD
ncbi:MAG TPA: hypothetical protein VFZ61_28375 [Polyangiales bacterium]